MSDPSINSKNGSLLNAKLRYMYSAKVALNIKSSLPTPQNAELQQAVEEQQEQVIVFFRHILL